MSILRILTLAVAACVLAAPATLLLAASPAAAASTLEAVQKRNQLVCGVNPGLAGFAIADKDGNWSGFDVDICRAIAAAVLGDARKVKFERTTVVERFQSLRGGQVDVLSRNTTWTASRDLGMGLSFAAVTFYDGQGFLVPQASTVRRVADLNGAPVCLLEATTSHINLMEFGRSRKIALTPLLYSNLIDARAAFFRGDCKALSSDISQLASVRANDAPRPEDYGFLPEVISKPLGPVVRRGDEAWLNIVKWTVYALIFAEEKRVGQKAALAQDGTETTMTVQGAQQHPDPDIQKLIGNAGDIGPMMGLPRNWAARAIEQVGNYGEIFERNVGANTPLKLERRLNALWTNGGLMYGMPIR